MSSWESSPPGAASPAGTPWPVGRATVAGRYLRGVLSPTTPLNPFDRADEMDLALLLVALVVVPGAPDRVSEAMASRPPGVDATRLPGRGRRVARPASGVRPPRAC